MAELGFLMLTELLSLYAFTRNTCGSHFSVFQVSEVAWQFTRAESNYANTNPPLGNFLHETKTLNAFVNCRYLHILILHSPIHVTSSISMSASQTIFRFLYRFRFSK